MVMHSAFTAKDERHAENNHTLWNYISNMVDERQDRSNQYAEKNLYDFTWKLLMRFLESDGSRV